MKKYRSTKVVEAGKITELLWPGVMVDDELINVGKDWLSQNEPKVGGYLTCNSAGVYSYVPADAFESAYAAIKKAGRPATKA